MTDFRTPLSRVRHLGSAKNGTSDWWAARLTSAALVPLGVWFAASLICLARAPYEEVLAFAQKPSSAILLSLLLGIGLHHAAHGVQVVLEDYVHCEGRKLAAIVLVKGAALALFAIGFYSILKLAFGA